MDRWNIIGCLGLVLLLFLGVCYYVQKSGPGSIHRATASLKTPMGGHFEVQTTRGLLNTQDLKGKTVFLFFGFTRCPYVCPTTLKSLKKMIKSLPPRDKDQAVILFISVDQNDSESMLNEKLQGLGEQFYAAAPDTETLKSITKLYGASFHNYTQPGSDEVVIDHTSKIFVINGNGVWVNSLDFDSTPEQLREAFNSAPRMSAVYAEHRLNRTIEILGTNDECDLSFEDCQIETERGSFKVSISPRPVMPEKNHVISVTRISSNLWPVEADFEGVELNMGLIRPELKKVEQDKFVNNFQLPVCELPNMQWKLNLMTKDETGRNYSFIFSFSTGQEN